MQLVSGSPKVICISFDPSFKPVSTTYEHARRDGWGKTLNPPQTVPQPAERYPVEHPLDAA